MPVTDCSEYSRFQLFLPVLWGSRLQELIEFVEVMEFAGNGGGYSEKWINHELFGVTSLLAPLFDIASQRKRVRAIKEKNG